ncbi:MAG: quinolinate synthase NadA [Alphaproteobacteria bacterium]|nr:quinolinate synthase NadA [Alphaproteobacteria bacterium]
MVNNILSLEKNINKLKQDKNVVILAHYYQTDDIQDIADFVGDSLDLSKKAASTDADVILFCGVKFMAEVAKILNPTKKVLVPDLNAGCSLEESCPADKFAQFVKSENSVVVSYINCSADIKALSDIIVTSSNAEKIIKSIPAEKEIIFAPDKNLGNYLIKKTGRKMKLWNGSCIVHEQFSYKSLVKLKERHQDALIIAHPECPENLLDSADFIGSTSRLLSFVEQNKGRDFIVLTESGIIHQMKKLSKNSNFYVVPAIKEDISCVNCSNCPHMKLNTMEKIYEVLTEENNEITLSDNLRIRAKKPLSRMLELS